MSAPLAFTWDGDAMTPLPRFRREADARYVVGAVYRLEEIEERSAKSHAHFFAQLNEYWQSIPEHLSEEYPDAETLRKKALIRCGYCDERSIVCSSKAEAARVAAFIRPMDRYAVVTVSEAVVRVYTAQSQSMRAMGKESFQASKDAVLSFAADLLGVAPETLQANTGRNAA